MRQLAFDLSPVKVPAPSGWYLRASMALAASTDELDPLAHHAASGGWL